MENLNKRNEQAEELKYTRSVQEVLGLAGIEHDDFSVDDDNIDQVIILHKDQQPQEKMIRVYRGLAKADKSILMQIPYAMRRVVEHEGQNEIEQLDELKVDVEDLANDPNYEKLLDYIAKVQPYLSENEIKSLEVDLEKIENWVLNGQSVRRAITFLQVVHGAGASESGIAPFVSATTDPKEAARYGNLMMVLDVPVSMVSNVDIPRNGEVMLKGVIDQKYITAYITKFAKYRDKEAEYKGVDKALNLLAKHGHAPELSETEALALRQEAFKNSVEQEKEQQQQDKELILLKRTNQLIKKYPDIGLDFTDIVSQTKINNLDIYAQARKQVYEHLYARLKNVSPANYTDEDINQIEIQEIIKKNRLSEKMVTDIDERLLELLEKKVQILELKQKEFEQRVDARRKIDES